MMNGLSNAPNVAMMNGLSKAPNVAMMNGYLSIQMMSSVNVTLIEWPIWRVYLKFMLNFKKMHYGMDWHYYEMYWHWKQKSRDVLTRKDKKKLNKMCVF